MGRKRFLKSDKAPGEGFQVTPLIPVGKKVKLDSKREEETRAIGEETGTADAMRNDGQAVEAAEMDDSTAPAASAAAVSGNTTDQVGKKKKRIRHRDAKQEADNDEARESADPHAHLAGLTKHERESLKRRSRKQKAKERKMDCFLCRQKGHSISNCPRNTNLGDGDNSMSFIHGASDVSSICYRCGSLEHILQKCDQKHNPKDPLPFSTCFVCKTKVRKIVVSW